MATGRTLPPIPTGEVPSATPAVQRPPGLSLVGLQRQLLQSAQTHASLRDLLGRGAALLSEYHAQLAIDQLRHVQHYQDIEKLSDETLERIGKTKNRLHFLYVDSMRLESDNAKIEESIQRKDDEIAAQQRQLALEESKLADATAGMQSLQSNVVLLSKELIQAKNELLEANQQQQLARRRQWDIVGDVAKLRESIAILKAEMRTVRKRLEAAHRAHPPRPAEVSGSVTPVLELHDEAATATSSGPTTRDTTVCLRPDCQYFVTRLQDLEEEDAKIAARRGGGAGAQSLSIPPPLELH